MIGFSRTLRALERERSSLLPWAVGVLLLLVGAWSVWLVVARTTLYVLSESGRFEATGNPMPVQAPVDGVVVSSDLTLGRLVSMGDALFAFDAHPFELQRSENEAKLLADRANLVALQEQVRAEERAKAASATNVAQTSRAALARVAVAQKTLESKQKESAVIQRLADESLASRLENLRTLAEADQSSAQATASRAEAVLQIATGETGLRDREVRIATLGQQLAAAEGLVALDEARVATLSYEIERRTVRAAAAGVLADVVPLPPGATLEAATRVATIVPVGEIRVVARFMPHEAIGRVEPGQLARIRVDNFPWTQYGTVSALVTQVGNEPRDGTVRVELRVNAPSSRVPVTHGLTGTVEVEVEELSPLDLLLRLAGQKLTRAKVLSVRDSEPARTQVVSNAR